MYIANNMEDRRNGSSIVSRKILVKRPRIADTINATKGFAC